MAQIPGLHSGTGAGCLPLPPLAALGPTLQEPGAALRGWVRPVPLPLHTLLSLQGRLVLSNKMARTIGFFYTLFLHCLVFLVGASAVVRAALIMLPSPPGQKGPRPSPSPTIYSWPFLSPSRASAQPGPSGRGLAAPSGAQSWTSSVKGRAAVGVWGRQERGSY